MNLLPMLQPLNRTSSAWPGASLQPHRTGTRPGLALATPGQPQPASDGSQLGSGPGPRSNAAFSEAAGAGSSGRQLPNGVWWLDPASARHDVLYGHDGSFVLQRMRRGGPGLVPSPVARLARRTERPAETGLTLAKLQPWQQPGGGLMAPLRLDQAAITDGCIVIDTEAVEVADDVGLSASESLPSTCLGMVLLPSPPSEPAELPTNAADADPESEGLVVESSSDNPRRTKKIKFTCNLCGTTSIRPVNPHAWAKGSVFGRCGGCNVIHKLRDNLKVFHELKGPIYPATSGKRAGRRGVVIPPGLPQAPGVGLEGSVGGFRLPEAES